MIRKGFTLMEVLIVIGLFSIVGIVAIDAYISGFQTQQTVNLQTKVMQDAQLIMNSLSAEISSKKIDYEEYFNQCVIFGSCPNEDLNRPENRVAASKYGINHGYYAWQFFFGGYQDLAQTVVDGFGNRCETAGGGTIKAPSDQCIGGVLGFSEDSNTGVNPQTASLEAAVIAAEGAKSSAVCSNLAIQLFIENEAGINTRPSATNCNNNDYAQNLFTELYLINPDENVKTIIGRGRLGTDSDNFAISKMDLNLANLATNQVEFPLKSFECDSKYVCTDSTPRIESIGETAINNANLTVPNRYNLYDGDEDLYLDFVPISPLSVNIRKLQFLINPLEDPSKGFREPNLTHPSVTIILEVEPSTKYRLPFFSSSFNLQLQTTVSTVNL